MNKIFNLQYPKTITKKDKKSAIAYQNEKY